MIKLNFSSNQYKSIMAIFSLIKDSCTDLTISNGRIHQLSESKLMLFDIDMTKYFNQNSIYMNNIKQQHSLLNLYALDNNEVQLFLDKKYIWADKQSKLECTIPEPTTLKPAFLDPDNSRAKDSKSLGAKIFETKMDRSVLRRIAQAAKTLEAKSVVLSIKEDEAKFIMMPKDMNVSTKFEVHTVDEVLDDSLNCDAQYDINSFLLQTEELKLTLYKNTINSSASTLIYEAEIEGIPVKLWAAIKYTNNN